MSVLEEADSLDFDDDQKELSSRVRTVIQELLQGGAAPSDISFVLSYLATELGMHVTKGSAGVVPVVLAGISNAIAEAPDTYDSDEEPEKEETVPEGTTIH